MATKDNRTPHEIYCAENAAYYTAIRFKPRGKSERTEHKTLPSAREYAAKFGDGRTMIYAVTDDGRDAHIENA